MTEPGDGPPPDVSVSIVNTSSRDFLLECLESLADDRDGPVSVEVTVLDNASEDGSAEAVRERFPWARVIEQRHRAGFGANHNTVIRATRGRYVYVLNEDAMVEPGSFEHLVAYLDAHPEVAVVGPHIRYPNGRHQPSAWRFPSPATAALGTVTLSRVGVEQSRGDEPRRVDWVMGCALLVRREALDRVDLFDERFFIYSEETDLCRRLADVGYETHFLPEVTVYHHVSQFSAGVPERRINEEWRSRARYWRKHHSPLAARGIALLTGLQYATRAAVGEVILRLPEGRRPVRIDAAAPARFRLHARNAWAGVRGPGLREYAEEWNREHPEAAGPADAAGPAS